MGETPPSLKLDLNLLDVEQMYLIFEKEANSTKFDTSINKYNDNNEINVNNFRSKFTNKDVVTEGGALLKELENAFIENAKIHNKITFNKLKTKKQIDDKLKKRLVKSFIKHSDPKLVKKMKKYEEEESFLDF